MSLAHGRRMLTAREVADSLGLHVNTVKRIPPEELPFARVVARGDRRYHWADVAAYLARLQGGPTYGGE